MTKKFKAINMAKLDHPLRKTLLPPDRVIASIGIESGMVIADIGCGIGYFSFPMALAAGAAGKVYALDINPLMLEELNRRIEAAGTTNIESVQSSENGFKLPPESVDVAFTSTVHHELHDPVLFLKQCHAILKPHGTMAIVDWNAVEESHGPPLHKRVPLTSAKADLEAAGFCLESEQLIGTSFYLVVGKKI